MGPLSSETITERKRPMEKLKETAGPLSFEIFRERKENGPSFFVSIEKNTANNYYMNTHCDNYGLCQRPWQKGPCPPL